jgi:hypothetical protein
MRKDSTPKRKQAPKKTTTTTTDRFQQQARRFIKLYFGRDTPAFVRDLLADWYTELESVTQMFWNDRRIAEIAVPLMLKSAADMGVDVESIDTRFMSRIAETWSNQLQDYDELPRSEPSGLLADLQVDAAAISRILNSATVPEEIKHHLAVRVHEYMDSQSEAPEVIKAQYPLAMIKHLQAEGGKESSGE